MIFNTVLLGYIVIQFYWYECSREVKVHRTFVLHRKVGDFVMTWWWVNDERIYIFVLIKWMYNFRQADWTNKCVPMCADNFITVTMPWMPEHLLSNTLHQVCNDGCCTVLVSTACGRRQKCTSGWRWSLYIVNTLVSLLILDGHLQGESRLEWDQCIS